MKMCTQKVYRVWRGLAIEREVNARITLLNARVTAGELALKPTASDDLLLLIVNNQWQIGNRLTCARISRPHHDLPGAKLPI